MFNNKGITIVALVITIIVMLILIGVTVTVALNGGLFVFSKNVVDQTKSELVKENDIDDGKLTVGDKEYDSIDKYVKMISKSKDNNYIGYYADIEGDGIVDGVIFADLLSGSKYGNGEHSWGGNYKYTILTTVTEENVKNYYISKEQYSGSFGKKDVITPVGNEIEKKERFYIMSLTNFTTPAYIDENDSTKNYPAYTDYYWYYNAYDKMTTSETSENFGTGYTNTGIIISKWNTNGGEGGYEGATQSNKDIWKHIQVKYEEGWFIPSRAEWTAFAKELGITSSNYKLVYGLSDYYWSSSRKLNGYLKTHAYYARLHDGIMYYYPVKNGLYVRLATIF